MKVPDGVMSLFEVHVPSWGPDHYWHGFGTVEEAWAEIDREGFPDGTVWETKTWDEPDGWHVEISRQLARPK